MTKLLHRLQKLKVTPYSIVQKFLGYSMYGKNRTKFSKVYHPFLRMLTGKQKKLSHEDIKWLREIFAVSGKSNLWDEGDYGIVETRVYKLI